MPAAVAERAAALRADGVPFVEATVVRAVHPTSVHAGDAALVHADGRIEGFVGGTCAEATVRVHAAQVLASGDPLLVRILPGSPEERAEEGAVTVTNPCLSGGTLEIFLAPHRPPARMVVVGDTPIARALCALGEGVGLRCEAAGADVATVIRDGDAALVVASHGRDEEAALTAALRAGVPYVALVGSRVRGAAVLAALDVPAAQKARVSSPAGLDIGARTAPEIALSILAEIVERRGRPAADVADVAEGVVPENAGASAADGTAVDPVCGMTVATQPSTLSVEHDGGCVWFCCAGCRDAFLADPAAHGG